MLRRSRHLAWLVFTVFVLGGCAALPKQDFNAAANKHVKKIAVVTGDEPSEYTVDLIHHPGTSFGLVGGLVAAADIASKSSSFTEAVTPKKPALYPEIEEVIKALEADGRYQVELVPVRKGDNSKFLDDYSLLDTDADAVLDIRLALVGYRALYPNTPYVPTLMATTQLVDRQSKRVLYEATIHYGEAWIERDGLVQINADTQYVFSDFGDLTGDVDRAKDGLVTGARAVGERIRQDLH